jgi:hypothetical protein
MLTNDVADIGVFRRLATCLHVLRALARNTGYIGAAPAEHRFWPIPLLTGLQT